MRCLIFVRDHLYLRFLVWVPSVFLIGPGPERLGVGILVTWWYVSIVLRLVRCWMTLVL